MTGFNTIIAHLLPLVPRSIVRIFADPYIAGETLDQALDEIHRLNRQNISATLDFLGEDPRTRSDCEKAVQVYKRAIDAIAARNLNSGVSVKPSQMGLKLDQEFCFDNFHALVSHARQHRVFVRIDMEDASLKTDTIDLYLRLKNEFSNVGIVMQAYLRMALDDTRLMIEQKANVRLCKGAYYWEDWKIAYKDMAIINSSYACVLEKLLAHHCFTGIATHDERLVFEALRIIDKLGCAPDDYEFQMLYGVQLALRTILHDQGHPIRVYVPFGREWFAYGVRRLKENPRMAGYIFLDTMKRIFNR